MVQTAIGRPVVAPIVTAIAAPVAIETAAVIAVPAIAITAPGIAVAATGDYKQDYDSVFGGVDEQENVVMLSGDTRLPLDRILSVYQVAGGWRILSDFLA